MIRIIIRVNSVIIAVMKTEMGVSVSIGVGVGLMTLAVGIYNIVRGRRIFRKKTAQQKLGFAFGSGL